MTRPRCVWAASQPWRGAVRVGSHHYAAQLAARGWDVAYLCHPISPLHALASRGEQTAARVRCWRGGGERDCDGRLTAWSPMTLLPPHARWPLSSAFVLDAWPYVTVPSLRRWLAARGFERGAVDLLVLDSERYGFLLDWLTPRRSAYRVVDHLAGFGNVAGAWVRRQRALLGRVDQVITTAHVLREALHAELGRDVILVPNGVELERFARSDLRCPDDLAAIAPPRVVYVGAIERWLDPDLVTAAARRSPQANFVLIGDARRGGAALPAAPNITFLGHRPYDSIPAYLRHAQLGIIPFREDALTGAVNPIKLYEYMAAGLPVVASDTPELRRIGSPARLTRGPREFAEAIDELLRTPAGALAEVRRAGERFVADADWATRADLLFSTMGLAEREVPARG